MLTSVNFLFDLDFFTLLYLTLVLAMFCFVYFPLQISDSSASHCFFFASCILGFCSSYFCFVGLMWGVFIMCWHMKFWRKQKRFLLDKLLRKKACFLQFVSLIWIVTLTYVSFRLSFVLSTGNFFHHIWW